MRLSLIMILDMIRSLIWDQTLFYNVGYCETAFVFFFSSSASLLLLLLLCAAGCWDALLPNGAHPARRDVKIKHHMAAFEKFGNRSLATQNII